jgi:head-tail adaptor
MARSPFSSRRYASGQYRDAVTLQTLSGGAFVDAAELFGRVDALSGYERLQAQQLQSAIEYRAVFPAAGVAITATMRLVWHTATRGDVTLNIQAVIVGVDELVCDCVEAHV